MWGTFDYVHANLTHRRYYYIVKLNSDFKKADKKLSSKTSTTIPLKCFIFHTNYKPNTN